MRGVWCGSHALANKCMLNSSWALLGQQKTEMQAWPDHIEGGAFLVRGFPGVWVELRENPVPIEKHFGPSLNFSLAHSLLVSVVKIK